MTDYDEIQQVLDHVRSDVWPIIKIIQRNPSVLWSRTYRTPKYKNLSLLCAVFVKDYSGTGSPLLYEINDILNNYADEYNLSEDEEYQMRVATFENNSSHMFSSIGGMVDLKTLKTLVELSPHGAKILDVHMRELIEPTAHSLTSYMYALNDFIDYLVYNSSYGVELLLLSFEDNEWDQTKRAYVMRYRHVIDTYRQNLRELISFPVIIWAEDPRIYRELIIDRKNRWSKDSLQLKINTTNVQLIEEFREKYRRELAQYYMEKEQKFTEEIYETLKEESFNEPNNLPLLMSSILPQQSRVYYERR